MPDVSRLRELLAVPLCLRSRAEDDEVEAALPKLLDEREQIREAAGIAQGILAARLQSIDPGAAGPLMSAESVLRHALASLENPSPQA
jgi:hypothetical protein